MIINGYHQGLQNSSNKGENANFTGKRQCMKNRFTLAHYKNRERAVRSNVIREHEKAGLWFSVTHKRQVQHLISGSFWGLHKVLTIYTTVTANH